jgi:hypothetical protein
VRRACSRRSAGQRRSRASITATSTSSRCTHERLGIDYGRCCGLALVCDRVFTCNRVRRCGDSCAGSTR